MEPPAVSHATPPTSPAVHTPQRRPSTANMRTHSRSQSRMADVASRSSDDDASRTAVKVGAYRACSTESFPIGIQADQLTCDE